MASALLLLPDSRACQVASSIGTLEDIDGDEKKRKAGGRHCCRLMQFTATAQFHLCATPEIQNRGWAEAGVGTTRDLLKDSLWRLEDLG